MRIPPDVSTDTRDLFRSAFRRHAAGVAVVTTAGPVGFTATSLASVSMEPPLVTFGIGLGSSSWPAIRDRDSFVVHILSESQRDLAALFARSGAERFGVETPWTTLPTGEPVIGGVAAWLRCEIRERFVAGDHRLVVGLVTEGETIPGRRPLLYHDGAFGSFT
ncbi:flavin reductase family protein [Herbidospora daliensis]|uniref:flavin reductase family protein n=1 Tax=Herbidospora daliensis TaxID=295585 RepID=UPI000785F390|nr:flavin reductase family protein [Herbidospora daliensis]